MASDYEAMQEYRSILESTLEEVESLTRWTWLGEKEVSQDFMLVRLARILGALLGEE